MDQTVRNQTDMKMLISIVVSDRVCALRALVPCLSSFNADLFGSAAACLAYTVNVYALSCPREICFGRYCFNHFASNIIAEILNVATLKADYVYVRAHEGIESCLAFWQIQFLD